MSHWARRPKPKVVRLYDGSAPGSESWTHREKESRSERGSVRAWNGVNLTLAVFPADPTNANGTVVVICPGGAFFQHGFGMKKQDLPADRWIERFAEWLDMQGLLKK